MVRVWWYVVEYRYMGSIKRDCPNYSEKVVESSGQHTKPKTSPQQRQAVELLPLPP